jgi:hypothetical protein
VLWLRKLGHGERIVLVVALGVGVDAFCSYFVPLGPWPFGSGVLPAYLRDGPPGWFRVVVWITFALGWAACSIGILRAPSEPPPHSG